MRSDRTQLDLLRHAPQAMAHAHREAAKSARINPFETPEQAERRAQHHLAEAQRLEQSA